MSFISETRNKDQIEKRRLITQFLYNFNNAGKAELLTEKLKRFIIRIVREKYGIKKDVKGIFKNDSDQFYSQLFGFLSEEVKTAMDEYVMLKKDELHEDVISSFDQSKKEVLQYATKVTKESEEKRLSRLSKEYEIMGNLEKAFSFSKSRLAIMQTKESLISFAQLAKKSSKFRIFL